MIKMSIAELASELRRVLVGHEIVWALPHRADALNVDADRFCRDTRNMFLETVQLGHNGLELTLKPATTVTVNTGQDGFGFFCTAELHPDDEFLRIAFDTGVQVVICDASGKGTITLSETA